MHNITKNLIKKRKRILFFRNILNIYISIPEDSIVSSSQIIIPYLKMIFSGGGIIPNEFLIKIQAKLSVPGVDQYILIGIRGYQD
ncbi:hypothetical protein AYK25_02370 [Thermoplasmatales archaeon SM1-50]|nr:MAG: hypothetical protein AYK25_02370 [Thermoplasmatales archaeon SM1-50]